MLFGFHIGSSRERTPSGKWFVSASLAAPEGIADVTNTESRRFRQSPLAKAIDAPRSEHVASSEELLGGLVARELLLTETSKHHFAIVQAGPAQESNRLPHTVKKPPCDQYRQCGLRGPSTRSNMHIAQRPGRTHHKHCTEPWRNDISNVFPLAHSSPTVLASSAASRAVVSCSVPRS